MRQITLEYTNIQDKISTPKEKKNLKPSRLNPGKLLMPQAPQQFKQLIMNQVLINIFKVML